MITGYAKKIRLVCGCHDQPIEMYVKQTDTDAFYACPKYYPDGREGDEAPCFNRLSVSEYENMVNTLTDIIQEEEEDDNVLYVKNLRFKTKQGEYKVIDEQPDLITIEVKTKSAQSVRLIM